MTNTSSHDDDPRLRKLCISSNLLTPPHGRLTGVQLGPANTQGAPFSQFALCMFKVID